MTGTSCILSARYWDESRTLFIVAAEIGASLGIVTLPASRCWRYRVYDWRYISPIAFFFCASVTITKCQPCVFEPVGACTASSRHSRINSDSTGREKSSRLRTDRVVANNSSGERLSRGMEILLLIRVI